jgi:hypothetical protein
MFGGKIEFVSCIVELLSVRRLYNMCHLAKYAKLEVHSLKLL